MDLSPSRTTAIEFDNPTPSRRRLSSRKPTNFDSISAKSQRESVMILDEVRRGRGLEGLLERYPVCCHGLS